jgi:hypothetical protein
MLIEPGSPLPRSATFLESDRTCYPSIEELEDWLMDGNCESVDGCTVEPDGICEHGYMSWLVVMGLI